MAVFPGKGRFCWRRGCPSCRGGHLLSLRKESKQRFAQGSAFGIRFWERFLLPLTIAAGKALYGKCARALLCGNRQCAGFIRRRTLTERSRWHGESGTACRFFFLLLSREGLFFYCGSRKGRFCWRRGCPSCRGGHLLSLRKESKQRFAQGSAFGIRFWERFLLPLTIAAGKALYGKCARALLCGDRQCAAFVRRRTLTERSRWLEVSRRLRRVFCWSKICSANRQIKTMVELIVNQSYRKAPPLRANESALKMPADRRDCFACFPMKLGEWAFSMERLPEGFRLRNKGLFPKRIPKVSFGEPLLPFASPRKEVPAPA